MNLGTRGLLLRGTAASYRGRLLLSIACIALGVALGGSVHTLHASALKEIAHASRALAGRADLEIRGPRSGFDDTLYAEIARLPEVAVANPIVDLIVPLAAGSTGVRILGVDPFRAMRLQPGFVAGPSGFTATSTLLGPKSAWLAPVTARRLALKPGDRLRVLSGSREVELIVAGTLPALEAGGEAVVMDIAAAQDAFDRVGRLSRIDLRLRPGVDARAFGKTLAARLPPGVVAGEPASIGGRAENMTRAYRVNLNALAMIALLTGLFLVFSTLALQAARRRQEFALLRAVGLTRRELETHLALEGGLLGLVGAAIGTLLGLGAAYLLLRGYGPDLGAGYFQGLQPALSPDPVALGAIAAAGIGAAAGGGYLVARAISGMDIADALRDRALDLPGIGSRSGGWALALAGIGFALLAVPPIGGLPIGGYAAIAAWLGCAVLIVEPVCRRALAALRLGERPIPALALAQVRHLPGHLTTSVAGIVVSVALCVAMGIMVFSFRMSLERWLRGVLAADIYLMASSSGAPGYFSREMLERIAALPEIRRIEPHRFDRLVIDPAGPPLTLVARPIDAEALESYQATSESAAPPGRTAVWINEAATDLHGWRPGSAFELPIAGRALPVTVVGTFRDYGRTWGAVLMDLSEYRRVTGDERADDVGLRLAPGIDSPRALEALRRMLPARGIEFQDATSVHKRTLEIFDRTFATTYALEAVAIAIALTGVTSSFAALAWSRRREFGVLRHLGLARREVLRMLAYEGAAAGAIGALIGLAAGIAISGVLVHGVTRQSFHWGMELHWPVGSLALLLAAVVALCALGARWSAGSAVRDEAVLAVKNDA